MTAMNSVAAEAFPCFDFSWICQTLGKERLSREALRERVLKELHEAGQSVIDVRILVLVDSTRNTANWDIAGLDPPSSIAAARSIIQDLQQRYDVKTAA
jgi:hypothetical protein